MGRACACTPRVLEYEETAAGDARIAAPSWTITPGADAQKGSLGRSGGAWPPPKQGTDRNSALVTVLDGTWLPVLDRNATVR